MAFQFEPYRSDLTGTIAELIQAPARARATAARAAAQAQAQAALQRGQNSAQLAGTLGSIINTTGQQIAQHYSPEAKQEREIRALQLEDGRNRVEAGKADAVIAERLRTLFSGEAPPTPEAIISTVGPERGMKIIEGLQALHDAQGKQFDSVQTRLQKVLAGMDALPEATRAETYPGVRQSLIQQGVIQETDAPAQYDPAWWQRTRHYGQAPKEPEGFTLSEGQTRFGPDGKPIANVAKPPAEDKTFPVVVKGPNGAPVRKLFTATQLAQGVEEYREPKSDTGGARFWVMRNGEPVRITEAEYRVGDKPASTREQGRPVTSGDAGRIADFDTSLDDLAVLAQTVAPKKSKDGKPAETPTGTAAKLGASLPKWVTDLTGWGEDAKSKQAVIDRVKQVIGKALEGGVLRKEDEYKYEKILPTIGDTASVVDAKLKGLQTAITKRRQTHLDSLEDAGFDVSKYRAREPHGQPDKKADPLGIRR